MRKGLRKVLNTSSKYIFIFLAAVAFRTFLLNLLFAGKKEPNFSRGFEFTIIPVEHLDYDFNKPEFEDEFLNKFVDDYIDEFACISLDYDIYELDENRISIYLNCGIPKNMFYDYEKRQELTFSSLVSDMAKFDDTTKRLLNLKYPRFVSNDADLETGVYDIQKEKITAYFKTKEYGLISVNIDNNEVKGLLNYDHIYTSEYQNEVYTYDKNKKTIAFTFDDGPSSIDLDIVSTLLDAHASGTFYLVGNRINSFPKSVKRILDAGMEVGNHTYDHKSLSGLSDEAIKNEVTKTNDVFLEATGVKLKTLRPSYGAINSRVQRQVGMPIVLWDIDTLDWKNRNAEKIKEIILENAHDGAIVLMHSLYPTTAEAVKAVLPELYKMGYQVASVEKLSELKGVSLTSGMTIRNIAGTK